MLFILYDFRNPKSIVICHKQGPERTLVFSVVGDWCGERAVYCEITGHNAESSLRVRPRMMEAIIFPGRTELSIRTHA